MCRNIKTLFNFDPPATDEEIRASSIQFVRKLLRNLRLQHETRDRRDQDTARKQAWGTDARY
jgi:hypothetical protein